MTSKEKKFECHNKRKDKRDRGKGEGIWDINDKDNWRKREKIGKGNLENGAKGKKRKLTFEIWEKKNL